MATKNYLKQKLRDLYLTCVGAFVFLFFCIFLVLFLPTFLFRPILGYLAPYLRPDLGKGLAPRSGAFAVHDDGFKNKTTIAVRIVFKGVENYENLVEKVLNNFVLCKQDDDTLRYPELQQYITNWIGYKFWKNETNFNIRDHVKQITDDNLFKTEADLYKIGQFLICGTFKPCLSPWEMTIIPGVMLKHDNDPDEEATLSTVLYFRAHHGLMDGYSIVQIGKRVFGQQTEIKTPAKIQVNYAQRKLSHWLWFPFQLFHVTGELAYNMVTPFLWKLHEEEKSPLWNYSLGPAIPIKDILTIKRYFNVSFTAVVFSLLVGGIRSHVAKKKDKKFMVNLPCPFSMPVKDHPDKLINHFTFALSSFPVGEPDPVKRLKMVHQQFEDIRNSLVPMIGYYVLYLYGASCNFVGKTLMDYKYFPIVTTYVPVDFTMYTTNGHPATQMDFALKLQQGQEGAILNISGYGGNIRITPFMNGTLMKKEEVEDLGQDIVNEAKLLVELAQTLRKDKFNY